MCIRMRTCTYIYIPVAVERLLEQRHPLAPVVVLHERVRREGDATSLGVGDLTCMHACMHSCTHMRVPACTHATWRPPHRAIYMHARVHTHACAATWRPPHRAAIHTHTTYIYSHIHTCAFMYMHAHAPTCGGLTSQPRLERGVAQLSLAHATPALGTEAEDGKLMARCGQLVDAQPQRRRRRGVGEHGEDGRLAQRGCEPSLRLPKAEALTL